MTTRRKFLAALPTAGAAFVVAGDFVFEGGTAHAQQAPAPLSGHFHPKGKAPSPHTLEVLRQAKDGLPFGDARDFDEQKKGLVAPMAEMKMADAGHVAWDMERFQFLDQQAEFDSIHPSLHRQSRLNNNYGLYEVIPGIYQVRGFDLSDITFIRGETGWIVFDPLISAEPVRAAWRILQDNVGEGLPVSAVIYSHTHGDHWGGVRALVDEADVRSGKIPVIAPFDFMDFTISRERLRRQRDEPAPILPVRPPSARGTPWLCRPGARPGGLGRRRRADRPEPAGDRADRGVRGRRCPHDLPEHAEHRGAPGDEHLPSRPQGALDGRKCHRVPAQHLHAAGAQVRDPLAWSKYIGEALYRFGQEAEVLFASHHWPRWGNERVQEVLRGQRDIYANMNNQVLHFANQGVTINQIHNVYEVPKGLQEKWFCRGYHGSPQHNARGVIQRYLGFWDCNPATLIPLSPEDSAPLYVEMMGGSDRVIARGRELHDDGKYLLASEIVNKLVQAEPDNADAKDFSPTSSSSSATSRRTRACAIASSPPPTSSGPASRKARRPTLAAPT